MERARYVLEDISLTTGRLDTLLLGLGQGLDVAVHGVLLRLVYVGRQSMRLSDIRRR